MGTWNISLPSAQRRFTVRHREPAACARSSPPALIVGLMDGADTGLILVWIMIEAVDIWEGTAGNDGSGD